MSKRRATASTTRAGQRRADAATAGDRRASRAPSSAPSRGPRPGLRIGRILAGALLAVAAFVAVGLVLTAGGRTAASRPSPSTSAQASPSALAAAPTASGSQLTPGGPLAQQVVATLQADPFRAHIDETTVARSTKGTITVTLTAKAVGDVSGKDVALHVSSTGAGPAVDQETVSVGGTTWIRRTGSTSWEVHPRAEAASAIDGLLQTIRVLDDPSQLADAGPDTVDEQRLRHLTSVGTISYPSPDGAHASFDQLDIWATEAGVPVLVRGSFSSSGGGTSLIGSVTIRYSNVGKSLTITPPSGAPTPLP